MDFIKKCKVNPYIFIEPGDEYTLAEIKGKA